MNKALLIAVSFLMLSYSTRSQITFQKLYGSGLETGYSVLELQDGYLIMGSTGGIGIQSDVYLVKTDFSGNVLWSKNYGGVYNEETYSIAPTSDGGFVMAGNTTTFTGPSLSDPMCIYMIKVDASGDLVWSNSINIGSYESAYCIKETFDHGFILTGYTTNLDRDLALVKTDSLGNTEWFQTFGTATSSFDVGRGVIQTRDSGYAVVGYSTAFSSPGDTSIYLIRTTSTGVALNTYHYTITNTSINQHESYGYDIIQNTAGNLIVTGGVGGLYAGMFYAYTPVLMETDSTGIFISSKQYSLNTGDCRGYSVKQTNDGGYIIGGTMGAYYPMMIKTNNALNTEWCYYYGQFGPTGPINTGLGFHAEETSDGGFVLAAMWTETGGYKMQLIKTDSLGQSGCNQGIPVFGGNASTPTHTYISGTAFSVGPGTWFANNTLEQTSLMPDSVLCITSGLFEPSSYSNSIKIYPNPASDHFNILCTNQSFDVGEIFIFDINGKLVGHSFISETQNEIDIKKLQPGVYTVKIIIENHSISVSRMVKL